MRVLKASPLIFGSSSGLSIEKSVMFAIRDNMPRSRTGEGKGNRNKLGRPHILKVPFSKELPEQLFSPP